MPTMAPPNPNVQTGPNPNSTQNPNQQPNPNQTQLDTIRIGLASLDSNVDAFAREAAHEELAEDKKKGPRLKRFAKSVWQTMMREHVVVKKTQQKREEILESGNLRVHQGESDQQWYQDVSRRYTSEFAEHLIHEEAGETFHKLSDAEQQNNPEALRIRTEINEFLAGYAKGDIDDPSVEPYLDRMFEEWRDEGVGEQFIGEGKLLAHNLVDGARQVKAAYEARQGLTALEQEQHLKDILAQVEINLGEAKVGSRSEIEATRSERLAKKLQNVPFINEGRLSKIGAVLGNEMVLSAMMSVAFFVGQRGASSAASSLIPGLGAGIIAGIRERRALRDERVLMDRRRDRGQEADTKVQAQAELDATRYESRPVGELLDELSALYDQNGDLTLRDRSDLDAALRLQGEIRARIQISDRDGARLINFADITPDEMEGRRFDLDLAMAKLESDMKKLFANPVAITALGINQGETYDDLLTTERDTMVGLLKGEMKAKDRIFNKLVLSRALERGLITAGTGMGLGALAGYGPGVLKSLFGGMFGEEIDMVLAGNETGTGSGATPNFTGTIGGEAPDGVDGPIGTPTEVKGPIGGTGNTPKFTGTIGGQASEVDGPIGSKLPGSIGGEAPDGVDGPIGGTGKTPEFTGTIGTEVFKGGDTVVLGDKTKVVLPEGFRAEAHSNVVKLTMPNGTTIESAIEKNGELSQSTLDILKNNGLNVLHHQDPIEGEPKVTHEKVNAREFVENHKNEMVKIKNEKWYHNNTSKYDLNELGLHNTKLDNGNIRISIKGMTSDGSFNGKSGVDWHEAVKDDQLKLYVSSGRGTQAHAFEIPFNADGTIDIDENSPVGALFNKEGKFIGGYQQASVAGETAPDGTIKIATLATVVGTNSPEINDVIVTPTTATAHTYTIVPPAEAMTGAATYTTAETQFAPVTPVYARRRLGEAEPAAPAPNVGNVGPNTANVGPNTGNQQANPNNSGGVGNGQNNPNTGNQQSNPNAGNAQTSPNANPGTPGPGPASPNSGPNNPNSTPGNPNTSQRRRRKAGNAGNNAGNSSNATNGGNPNQQKQSTSQANGGPNQTPPPPNNGRPTNNDWRKFARQQTGPAPAQPNSGQTNPNTAQQNGNPNYQYATSYTAQEQKLLKDLTNDPRDMPDTFKPLQWNPNMTPTARKIIAVVLHGLIDASNRQPGETEGAWRIRVITAGRVYAQNALGALGQALPGVRPFMQEAFEEFLRATEPANATPNSGTNTNTAGANASANSTASTP